MVCILVPLRYAVSLTGVNSSHVQDRSPTATDNLSITNQYRYISFDASLSIDPRRGRPYHTLIIRPKATLVTSSVVIVSEIRGKMCPYIQP